MESGLPTAKPRPRRSHSALPKIGTSNHLATNSVGASEHKKGHLTRHSLHHHLPHPYRRHDRDAQSAASSTLVDSDLSRQNTRAGEYAASSSGSRPQSLKAIERVRDEVGPLARVRPEDAGKERQRRTARDNELRSNLQGLTELSMATTRRLDDIYYSILERVSQLHSTIDSLQELSSLTRNLHHGFEQEAEELRKDLEDQIGGFGGFETQKNKIDSLEERIMKSKDMAARLNDRLDATRKRIAVLENREEVWQTTVNRRLNIFWGALGALVVLIIFLMVFNSHTASEELGLKSNTTARTSVPNDNTMPLTVKELLADVKEHNASDSTCSSPRSLLTSDAHEENPLDRLFDEL